MIPSIVSSSEVYAGGGHLIIGVPSLLLVIGLCAYWQFARQGKISILFRVQLEGSYAYNDDICVAANSCVHCTFPKTKMALQRMTYNI